MMLLKTFPFIKFVITYERDGSNYSFETSHYTGYYEWYCLINPDSYRFPGIISYTNVISEFLNKLTIKSATVPNKTIRQWGRR